jgi:hypothetical protein
MRELNKRRKTMKKKLLIAFGLAIGSILVAQAAKICVKDEFIPSMRPEHLDWSCDTTNSSVPVSGGVSGRYCWCQFHNNWAYTHDYKTTANCVNVCKTSCGFPVLDDNVKGFFCSTSSSQRVDTTDNSGYCWCFASGSWSYSGINHGNCPAGCPSSCGV